MTESLDQTLNKLFEHFQCPICMSTLGTTYTTKACAHRFCEKCIKECINTLHRCPLCNHHIDAVDDVVRDNQYDDLIQCASKLKEKDEEMFIARLVDSNNNETVKLSPLENVLKKYMMNIFNSHQNYYRQLERSFLSEVKSIDDNSSEELVLENDPVKREAIQKKAKDAKRVLEEKFKETTNVICRGYDKYLAENLPKPSVIQAPVRVRILKKDFKFDGLVLKPNDDIKVAFQFIEKKVLESTDDKIVSYGDDVLILCFNPFSKHSAKDIQAIYDRYQRDNYLDEEIQLIPNHSCMPVLELSIKPGSEIVFCGGGIKFESELPLECFFKKFDKNQNQTIDYYRCNSCDLNWICKNCSLVCHADHEKVPFIIGHKPTWACCYCKRKGCSLLKD